MTDMGKVPAGIDQSTPSVARIYDYILGGTHNFPVDRAAGDSLRARVPDYEDGAYANRGFHGRAARWMATERGIRQFIDLGSGLPTQRNTHHVVHEAIPDASVVYVDIDPMIEVLGRDLLDDEGTTAVINADLRDVDGVLNHPDLRKLIDLSEPTGLLATAVIHFIPDSDDPYGIVARYLDALASGSYLALSHVSADVVPTSQVRHVGDVFQRTPGGLTFRTKTQIGRFFDGLELVAPYPEAAPGLTFTGVWGAEDPEMADSGGSRAFFCGVARKP